MTPNVENFLEIAKHIYPTEIPLEQTDKKKFGKKLLINLLVITLRIS